MNPSKSLMVLGAVLVVAPALARAGTDAAWPEEIHTKTQVYFVAKDDVDRYHLMQERKKEGSLALGVEEKQADKIVKVASKAVLSCAYAKSANKQVWGCKITVNQGAGGKYEVEVEIAKAPPPVAAPTRAASDDRPAGVSQETWAAVVNSGLPKEKWAKVAAIAEQALKSPTNPNAVAKWRGASKDAFDKILKGIADKLPDVAAGKTSENQLALNALAEADKLPDPQGAKTNVPTATGKAEGGGQNGGGDGSTPGSSSDKLPNALAAALVDSGKVQVSFAARLKKYLLAPTGDASFISPAAKRKEAEAILGSAIDAWVKKATASENERGRAAMLYIMLGEEGNPQSWYQKDPTLTGLSAVYDKRAAFNTRMSVFTVGGAKSAGKPTQGPYTGDSKWAEAVLYAAEDFADEVWKLRTVSDSDAVHSIGEHEQAPMPPSNIGKSKGLNDYIARAFNTEELYAKGGAVFQIQVPGSSPPKYRRISVKMYSEPTDWGPPTAMKDQIGIFDITEPGDGRTPGNIFGQYFPVNQRGELKFALDDRAAGNIAYKLKINGGNLSFVSIDKKGNAVGDAGTTTISDLYEKRAALLEDDELSYSANLGGKQFRVIGQGGFQGGLLYYEMKDGKPVSDSPTLVGDLTAVNADGKTKNIPKDRPLGAVRTASGDYEWWYLRWNEDRQLFEHVKGDKPKSDPTWKPAPPKKDGGTAGGGDQNKPDPKNPGGGDQTDPNQKPPDGKDPGNQPASKLTDCKFGNEFTDLSPKMALYRQQANPPLKLYTEPSGNSTDANPTYACVFTQLAIFFPGFVTAENGAVALDNDYLRINAVTPGPRKKGESDGVVRFEASEITNLQTQEDPQTKAKKLVFSNGSDTHNVADISAINEYYIPVPGLEKAIKGDKGLMYAYAEPKLAQIVRTRTVNGNAKDVNMRVYIHPGDDAAAVFKNALLKLAKGTPCVPGESIDPTVAGYIDARSKDPDLAKALADFGGADKGPNASAPSIAFNCKVSATGQMGNYDMATPSWPDAATAKKLTVLDGKIGAN